VVSSNREPSPTGKSAKGLAAGLDGVAALNDTLSYLSGLAGGAVGIWFFFWPLRRKYELDYNLDSAAQTVRWSIVLAGFGVALLPGPQFKTARIVAGIILVAFLAWPNFAYYLTLLFTRSPARRKGTTND
jgi:hypothetical protein